MVLGGKGRRIWGGQLRLLDFLEASIEVKRLSGQDEAIEVVVLALKGHTTAHAWAHGRYGRTAGATRISSRASETDAQASLTPVVKVVVVVSGSARCRGLELEARRVGREFEIIAPVVVDLELASRFFLAQPLDGATQQSGRGHAGGDGDAGEFGRGDGLVGGDMVVGGNEQLPVVVARVGL